MPISGCKIRGLLMLVVCSFLFLTGAYLFAQDQINRGRNVEMEHRVTTLEVEMMQAIDDIKSIKSMGGGILLGIVALLGERGYILFFKKGE